MPRTTSSWILVSSRATATGRSGSSSARTRSDAATRLGDSNATSVSGDAKTCSSAERLRGRNPANRHRSAGSALATSAARAADGPGSTSTASPAATHACTKTNPGSDTSGVPASETKATTAPPRIFATSSFAR